MIDMGALVARLQVDSGDSIQQLDNFSGKVENADGKSIGLAGSLKKLAAGFAIGVAIKKTADAVVGCVQKADELKQSFNTLQTQTGATDAEMQGLEESLKNIYANNYGESFEDIATAMAEVKNQTGLAGDELETMTENAIALRDTFGFEVQESTRAADMMMKQFGITSEEAFNLIAQGSQNGLDKNGNLLDSINEYSVHFQQLGLDSEEMFNMFSNGAKTGVFDVDKLGDAVKEFGIRAKDGSNTTIEAYQALGLNADELQVKFAQGGESANEAFQTVTKALNDCDDEVVKNTAGVNLFGTMWEDMGEDAVKALTNTNGEFDKTADNLEKIKEIKYDSLGNAFQGIGRQMETGLMIPLGERLLPKLNEFANYIQENMPQIQATFQGIMEGIGGAITFVTDNLNIIIPILAGAVAGFVAFNVINTILPLFTAVQTAITGTTTVQAALNAVMAANPFGAVVTAIGLLVAAGVALYMNWDTVKQKCEDLFNKISEVWENIKTTITTKVEEIKTAINNKIQDFKNAGKAIFTGLWDGIKEVWEGIKSWVDEKVSWLTDKLTFWRKSKSEMNDDSDDDSDGSHRNGLSYVPFDGYNSILHKGEMVLTQAEADRYRKGEGNSTNNANITNNFYGVKEERTAFEVARETKKTIRKLGLA
ncbi:phage tail tape measure protein [Anaerotignum sp.]|uniref:phage tail tape measure protein n=1 Tax=Anaerotignum sp. TaxID=2039241 RepID=UPI003324F78B